MWGKALLSPQEQFIMCSKAKEPTVWQEVGDHSVKLHDKRVMWSDCMFLDRVELLSQVDILNSEKGTRGTRFTPTENKTIADGICKEQTIALFA